MNTMKKNAEVTGRLHYPLEIGMPAIIIEQDGVLRTSRVVSVDERTGTCVRFETLNTNYCVRFTGGIQHERV